MQSREQEQYELVNVENITAEQRARRAAWLSGPQGEPHP
jgi:hypothetical protein